MRIPTFTTMSATLIMSIVILGCGMPNQQKIYTPAETKLSAGKKYMLTPKTSAQPRINSVKVFGVRPGNPFLFTIVATGRRPMTFEAQGLPDGLTLDKQTGCISGRIDKPGIYTVTLKAASSLGSAERAMKIVAGEQLSLIPPMGWNSWNCWAGEAADEKVRASAKAMVDSGLIEHGWTYINIDDGWQGRRSGALNAIQPNEKFPDMQGLCVYVHSLGLKIGIYSTPWVTSYTGFVGESSDYQNGGWSEEFSDKGKKYSDPNHRYLGKYSFEPNDAKQWAVWGIDYLKYDWRPNDEPSVKRMADALRASGRDMVYSLSNTAPFEGAAVLMKLANSWRTTNDLRGTWSKEQLPESEIKWGQGIIDIWQQQEKWAPYNGPGHWNDPDMLIVGKVGWGKPHPTNLTPDEQYTHISLWCLWSSPLLLGCPLDQLDDFTLNLLTNDEVLALDQDSLGRQAVEISSTPCGKVMVKDLDDGSKAVGLFNIANEPCSVEVTWKQLGIAGKQTVRDLWRQKDIGTYAGQFQAMVRPHSVVLVRIQPEK